MKKERRDLRDKEVLVFQRPRDGRVLLGQIEPDNKVTLLSDDGTKGGHTRPLGSPEEARRYIIDNARLEGFDKQLEVRVPEKILRTS